MPVTISNGPLTIQGLATGVGAVVAVSGGGTKIIADEIYGLSL